MDQAETRTISEPSFDFFVARPWSRFPLVKLKKVKSLHCLKLKALQFGPKTLHNLISAHFSRLKAQQFSFTVQYCEKYCVEVHHNPTPLLFLICLSLEDSMVVLDFTVAISPKLLSMWG